MVGPKKKKKNRKARIDNQDGSSKCEDSQFLAVGHCFGLLFES